MKERDNIDQQWFKYRKALLAQIRLKHTLRAEDEINQRLPAARRAFEKSVQKGVLPAPPSLAEALGA